MEALLSNVYAQAGAFGLLALSGWVVWYFERRERKVLFEKYDQVFRTSLRLNLELKKSVEALSETLELRKFIQDSTRKG